VLLLVPVYALDAALGLQRRALQVPRQLARQAYESFVLLSFMRFIFVCLGLESDYAALRWVRLGIYQYIVVVGFFYTLGAMMAWRIGLYHEGVFDGRDTYPYFMALQCASQSWALWSIVKLVHCTRRELRPIKPVVKFMSIKLLIFFTWLQTVGILFLESVSSLGRVSLWIETEQSHTVTHWWDPFHWYDVRYTETHQINAWRQQRVRDQVGSGLGNFILCAEMVAFAILHCVAYPASEWDPSSARYAGRRLFGARCAGLGEGLVDTAP